jgi:hypothetical protein
MHFSQKGTFATMNFSKSEEFSGMHIVQFGKITDREKPIKIECIC